MRASISFFEIGAFPILVFTFKTYHFNSQFCSGFNDLMTEVDVNAIIIRLLYVLIALFECINADGNVYKLKFEAYK